MVKKLSCTMLPIMHPLSFIFITFWRLPYPITIFHAIDPISLKYFSVVPMKNPCSWTQSIFKLTDEDTIYISLISINFDIILEVSLKYLFLADVYSFPWLSICLKLSKIYPIISSLYLKFFASNELLQVKLFVHHNILLQIQCVLWLLWYPKLSIRQNWSPSFSQFVQQ